MAVASIAYQRTFHSIPSKENFPRFIEGSHIKTLTPELELEDQEIRERLNREFNFRDKASNRIGSAYSFMGFDGNIIYDVEIMTRELDTSKDGKIPQKYTTVVYIKKAGAEERLTEPCDLERTLLGEKFTEVK